MLMSKQISEHAQELYNDSIIWDMVWPWEPWCDCDFDKMARFQKTGFSVVSATIAGDNQNISEAIQKVGRARDILQGMDNVLLCESIEDVKTARKTGKLGVLLHFEGTRCYERNLDMVEVFYKLGIRHNLLTFNNANSAGSGAMDENDGGLTGFGKNIIRKMEQVGMLLDLSHVGRKTAMDAIDAVTGPCVYSHSNVNTIFPHPRNITDEEIRGCAETGGLVGIPSSSMYHGDPDCKPETLFKHLDYIVQLVGSDHAALGLDCIFDPKPLNEWMRARPEEWPDTKDSEWNGISTAMPEDVLTLTSIMLDAGYTDQDVKNILGDNYVRVCSEVWK